jgi:hypothetical protein
MGWKLAYGARRLGFRCDGIIYIPGFLTFVDTLTACAGMYGACAILFPACPTCFTLGNLPTIFFFAILWPFCFIFPLPLGRRASNVGIGRTTIGYTYICKGAPSQLQSFSRPPRE